MIEFVVISLLAILLLAYYTLGRNISRPTILYVSGFLFCSIVAYGYKEEWGLDKMSPITAFVLIGGALVFYLVELNDYRKYPFEEVDFVNIDSDDFKPIAPIKLVAFLVFQIIAIGMMARSEMSYALTDDLAYAMMTVNEDQKFGNISVSHPFYIEYPYDFCMWARTMWCVYLPYYLYKPSKYNKQKVLIALNLLIGTVGTLVPGGRTAILYDIISIIFWGYMCFQYKRKWVGGLFSRKIMLSILFVMISFALLFNELGGVIGRKENDKTIEMILSVYCGAEIKNLDDYIQSPFKQGNEKGWLAQYTFCGFYDEYQRRFEGVKGSRMNQPDLAFNSYGDYPLGNVYTTYFNFILDFGFFGAILFTGFMSWICAFLYRKTMTSSFWETGQPNLWILYCVYKIPGACFLSFFANKFFENITISWTMKLLLFWWVMIMFLQDNNNQLTSSENIPVENN